MCSSQEHTARNTSGCVIVCVCVCSISGPDSEIDNNNMPFLPSLNALLHPSIFLSLLPYVALLSFDLQWISLSSHSPFSLSLYWGKRGHVPVWVCLCVFCLCKFFGETAWQVQIHMKPLHPKVVQYYGTGCHFRLKQTGWLGHWHAVNCIVRDCSGRQSAQIKENETRQISVFLSSASHSVLRDHNFSLLFPFIHTLSSLPPLVQSVSSSLNADQH